MEFIESYGRIAVQCVHNTNIQSLETSVTCKNYVAHLGEAFRDQPDSIFQCQ